MFQAERRGGAKPLRMSMLGKKHEGQQSWSKVSKRWKGRGEAHRGHHLVGRLVNYVEFPNPLSRVKQGKLWRFPSRGVA